MAEEAQSERRAAPATNAWFFNATPLAELVKGVRPFASANDLALDELTSKEATSFLHDIEE